MRGTRREFDDHSFGGGGGGNSSKSSSSSSSCVQPTKLYTTNHLVDVENKKHLQLLGNVETRTYNAVDTVSFQQKNNGNNKKTNKFKTVIKNCPIPSKLTLKIGASVMLLRNLDQNIGLVNGCLGKVIGFNSTTTYPIVSSHI